MNILSALDISKSYSEEMLLNEVSLGIDEGEKLGIIGVNGTGKSTLLKIIAGVETYNKGKIIKTNGLSIEYLPQNQLLNGKSTVLEQIFKGDSKVMKLLRKYEEALSLLNKLPEDKTLQKKVILLTQKIDNMKAWSIESEVKTILTKLGITDFDLKINSLSGGQKKRIALASALIAPTDLLILDEPTNQLDNDTIDWLEKYLNNRSGALLMVTHDRYFLQRICTRIIEIEKGSLYNYQANYEQYLALKAQREENEIASERKRQSLYRKELEWMQRGARARTTKQKARIERFDILKEGKLDNSNNDLDINVGTRRLGKKIIELINIDKGYHGITLINQFSYNFDRADRIGIIGPNGSGKSTLLNLIAKRVIPDKGIIDSGETIKIGFFMQENDEMNHDLTIIDYIKEQAEFLKTKDGLVSASKMLERFLFPTETHWKLIAKLSGGEKRRLYLLKVLMSSPNVILLDEPTNDLDIYTLTILENYLNEFSGVVITVSHDRYFLDRVAKKIFIFDGNQNIIQFQGNYSDYYEAKQLENNVTKSMNKEKVVKPNVNEYNKKNKTLKFTFNEQREFESIDDLVESLEEKVSKVNNEVQKVASDFTLLQEKLVKKEKLDKLLSQAMERWEYLYELAKAINDQKKKIEEK